MILFLDTVSPLPEFSLIEDNKIIYSKKILTNDFDKMSDCIIPAYIDLEKKFLVNRKLQCLIVNTGPGSYTALRVGIAFLSGLSIAKKIDFIGVSCLDLYLYGIEQDKLHSSALYVGSSNNQNFIYLYDKKNGYIVHKIEKNKDIVELENLFLKQMITNINPKLINKNLLKNIKHTKIYFHELVKLNLKNILLLPRKAIINPIYVSNNTILN